MPITVNGPGGVSIDFPDGTDSGTIDGVMRQHFGEPQSTLARQAQIAVSPITTYPGVQQQMANEGLARAGTGIDQIRSGIDLAMSPEKRAAMSETEQAGAGPVSIAKGVGNVIAGGTEYLTSPISAAYRTLVGKPVEDVTGIPKEYTEFGAMLATPGLGLTRLPKAPPRVPVAAPLTQGEEVSAAGQRLGVDLPRDRKSVV